MKKFFQKVKLDAKFSTAGEGHKLSDEPGQSMPTSVQTTAPPVRHRPMSESQANAAIAAIERLEKSKPTAPKQRRVYMKETTPSTSNAKIVTQIPVKDEPQNETTVEPIKFISALTGEIVTKRDLIDHYRENLLLRLSSENALSASCSMVHTLNKDKDMIEVGVQTLCKYIENIIANETEVKFRKIRKENKAFSERVASLEGAEEFLNAAGFKLTSVRKEGEDELYFVFPNEADLEKLKAAKKCLITTKPLVSKLHRDRKVFRPSEHTLTFNLPRSFYDLTLDEIRREQDTRSEELELSQQLRTKAMREKPKSSRKYNFTVIRVRFPDGLILQGTFGVYERFSDVRHFIADSVNVEWAPYVLRTSTGQVLDQDDETLTSLSLIPSVVLNLSWIDEVYAQLNDQGVTLSLKSELVEKIEILS